MTNQLASLEQRDYFYLDPFSSVNLGTYIIKMFRPGCNSSKNSNNWGKAAYPGQTQSKLTCSKSGNNAHPRGTPCLAKGRRCPKMWRNEPQHESLQQSHRSQKVQESEPAGTR